MKLNDARDIRLGSRQVKAVYLGEKLIWPKSAEPDEPDLPEGYTRLLAIQGGKAYAVLELENIIARQNLKIVLDCGFYHALSGSEKNYCNGGCGMTAYFDNAVTGNHDRAGFACIYDPFDNSAEEGELVYKYINFSGRNVLTEETHATVPLETRMCITMTIDGTISLAADVNGDVITLSGEQEIAFSDEPEFTIRSLTSSKLGDFFNSVPISSGTRIFDMKIYDGETLIGHYIPCMGMGEKNVETAGLFDVVGNQFHYSSGMSTSSSYVFTPVYLEVENEL